MTNNCEFHVRLVIFNFQQYDIMAESKLVQLNFDNSSYNVFSTVFMYSVC